MTSSPISPETLLQQLGWRYATKSFDPTRSIPPEIWTALEQALVLTPTSYGMQPFRFVVITERAVKDALVPHSWNQRQPADCSHFVVFAARVETTEAEVDRYLSRIASVRSITTVALTDFRKVLVGDLVHGARGQIALEWATRQAYIALGNFMTAAALIGIDTCPMEGFVPEEYDALLGLSERGLTAVVACAAGYRDAGDKYAALSKVRLPTEELVVRI